MIESGELERLIALGVVGVTSNPTIFMKAVAGSTDYDERFQRLIAEGHDTMGLYEGLVLPDIADAADILRPVYDRTGGVDGYVSLEVNPGLAYDTEGTIAEARRLYKELERPNVLIKVPATEEGLLAIETLIGDGIGVNATLIFSLTMHEKVMQAYVAGLERHEAAGGDLSRVASVASFFISRVDTLVDRILADKHPPHADIEDLLGTAAIANARRAYARFRQFFDPQGTFGVLAAKGARVQRPVWASTSTKNPDYPPTKYVDGLIGADTVNTLPPDTIQAALREGATAATLHDDPAGAHALVEQLARLGIHIEAVADKLLADGVALFAKSFEDLLANLTRKRETLRAAG
jgi:transaldolase